MFLEHVTRDGERWDSLAWACSIRESWSVNVPSASCPYSLRPWTSLTYT